MNLNRLEGVNKEDETTLALVGGGWGQGPLTAPAAPSAFSLSPAPLFLSFFVNFFFYLLPANTPHQYLQTGNGNLDSGDSE